VRAVCRLPLRRHWTSVKARLSFCAVARDCDDEGCLRLQQRPTPEQAALIRNALGIRKRQEISEETRERLKAYALERSMRHEALSEPRTAADECPVPEPTLEPAPIFEPGLAK
jgi:hypothetical protein